MLIKCFHFKIACFYTHDYIVPFVNKDKVKLDLKVIYLNKNENYTDVPDDQVVCGFCMGLIKSCSAIPLNVEERDFMLESRIERCLSGLDLSLIEKPVVCASCFDSLENYFRFVTNCLLAEEKIKKYRETLDISSGGQIDLSSFLQFTIGEGTTSEANGNLIGIIKEEKQFCDERENADEGKIDNGAVTFKLEQKLCDGGENSCTVDNKDLDGTDRTETFCGKYGVHLKEENHLEMEDQKFIVNEAIEIKTDENDLNRFEDGIISPQPGFTTVLCSMSSVEGDLSCTKHTSTNESATEIAMYQCECCPSEVTMYNCDSCLFHTKCRGNLERHLLVHKDPPEVTMYKCYSCSYRTKHKENLKNHLLVHKNPSEATMYSCDSCSYRSKYKGQLKMHVLVHRDPSETTMYKCDSCSYRTKRKQNLRSHFLIHKDTLEATMYKCDSCSYQTMCKCSLKKHLLQHQDPSELTMYNCDLCSFQTKRRDAIKKHQRKHGSLL